jgi:hypothetical protein
MVTTVDLTQDDLDRIQILCGLDLNPQIRSNRAAISYALKVAVDNANKREVAYLRAEIIAEREVTK